MTVQQALEFGWGARAALFSRYWNAVDAECHRLCGMGLATLPDWDIAQAFEFGVDHTEAARMAITEQEFVG